MNKNEDDLICDFAETYHIYNYKELPLSMAALLLSGLRPDSRVMMARTGMQVDYKALILTLISDSLRVLIWQNSKDGQDGKNMPKMMISELIGQKKEDEIMSFASGEEFEKARNALLRKETK